MRNNPILKIAIALVAAIISFVSYCNKTQVNPVTGKKQKVSLTPEQEVALGLQSSNQMIAQFGGEVADPEIREQISAIGNKIVANTEARNSPYQFNFHVLSDNKTINAFALPGGQIFITMALLSQLTSTHQIAGVLGHEIGHVIGRHSAQQMAKQELTSGLVSAVSIATSDGSNGSAGSAIAQYVGSFVNMKYGREDELESDDFAVKYMLQCGFNPSEMIQVMEVLKKASGGNKTNEFMSTHPSPENRVEKIKEAIEHYSKNQ
jgi:predicted Zn-dependent protease